MTFAQFVAVVRKRWFLILIPFLLACGSVGTWSMLTTPLYTATASSYFSMQGGGTANELYQGANYTQQQLGSFAELATKPIVLDAVIDDLDLDTTSGELARSVSADVMAESVIIDLSATSASPQLAADLANAIALRLGVVVKDLSPVVDGQPTIDVVTVATAVPPRFQSSPDTRRNVLAAGLGGLLLGLVLVVARERLDTRVRGESDLPGGQGVLASVEDLRDARQNPILPLQSRTPRAQVRAEAFRRLRTNLRFIDVDHPPRVIVMTSAVAGEGKSSTAVNLARVLVQDGHRVVLVDGDLRRPSVAAYAGLEGSVGLTDVLAGSLDLETALRRWQHDRLQVLPSGSLPPNPSELLGSDAMASLMGQLRDTFDFVILDTPPLLPVIDAAVAGVLADGVVMVVRHGHTTRPQLEHAADSLRSVDARLLGFVFNRTPRPSPWRRKQQDYYEQDGRRSDVPRSDEDFSGELSGEAGSRG
ncbi:polysaccharide biosynthesis tyrosine autokinase [Auraticoccus monumenti]|uniref:Capsular exopolysaccharide family n=1 Tax=Auraticoccus monumenti TaxID=675864 RepID=A0A1G6VTP3_9ACTN|nr:polysaccharide biosynthesis tyrosine autokinase [Auraticoccus monumenti]SDD56904.1 capsular exopolysaccharide family [Auraticoccus monumenti]